MTWSPDPKFAWLVPLLFGRRQDTLAKQLRDRRGAVVEELSHRGLSGGPLITGITKAYLESFGEYASGVIEEVLDLVRAEDGSIEPEAAEWARQQLEPNVEVVARGVGNGISEAARTEGLKASVQQAIESALNGVKRDLSIALDKATVGRPAANRPVQTDAAFLDIVVSIKNRRAFETDMAKLLLAAPTADEPVALVMFDIDHFKQVNDDHGGHETGDEALRAVVDIAGVCIRGKGTAYRYGGDEFALVLPNHTAEEAVAVAERLRAAVNRSLLTSRSLRLSLSIGVATFPLDGADTAALKKAADAAAYEAKKLGRNKVCVARPVEEHEGGAVVFKSLVELAMSYTELQIRSERHDYQLQLRIRNGSLETISEYHVDLEMPSAVVVDVRSHAMYVADRSTRDVALFRATNRNHREPIYPGDDKVVMTVPYYVDHQLFWDRKEVFEQPVRATLYRGNLPPLVVTKPFKELQVF